MTTSIDLERRYGEVLAAMMQDSQLSKYIDNQLKIPAAHRGTDVRLIILGQDPTVKDERSRKKIIKVLNLKGSGALHNYLTRICVFVNRKQGHAITEKRAICSLWHKSR